MGYGGTVSDTPHGRRFARRGIPLLIAALFAAMAPATGASAVGEPVFTFTGGGWGHSSGMSQYGAYGMAKEGKTYDQILANYYPSSPLADADPALLAAPIWVNLTQEQNPVTFYVRTTGAAPTAFAVTITQGAATIPALQDDMVKVDFFLPDKTCQVTIVAAVTAVATPYPAGPCSIDVTWDGFEDSPTTRLELGTASYARGVLHIRPDNTLNLDVSLEIHVEDYLLGLGEMPAYWGSEANGGMEALKAQVVAARSYALNRVVTRGNPANRTFCWCHLYDTTTDQVYAGWHETSEHALWIAAVQATFGKVLGSNPSHPAGTQYTSSTFGWTETGSDDHWALKPEVRNPNARWSVSFTATALAAKLGMADVTGAQVTGCSSVTGSISQITFIGSGGSLPKSTYSLRSILGLKSQQVINVGSPISGAPPCPGPGLIPSDSPVVTVGPPGAPTALSGLPGSGQVTVSWQAPASNGGAAISDYAVQYRPKGTADWILFPDAVSADLQVVVTGLSNGTPYEFQVAAVNSAGAGGWSAVAESTPVPSVPSAPASLQSTPGSRTVKVSWLAPPDGGVAISDYVVHYRRKGYTSWSLFRDGVSADTHAHVGGLTNGVVYQFRVAAKNGVGAGPWSATTEMRAGVPTQPQSVVPTPGNRQVALSWQAPAANGGASITDYVIQYRRAGNSTWVTFPDGRTSSRHTHVTGLTNGVTYQFRIAAKNARGTGLWSSTLVEATPGTSASTTSTVTQSVPSASLATFLASTTPLRLGSRGDAVYGLQVFLGSQGYQVGTPDGIFGALTELALESFQRTQGLTADGVAGAATRNAVRALTQ
jgi:SpoIID/LytB domain protein